MRIKLSMGFICLRPSLPYPWGSLRANFVLMLALVSGLNPFPHYSSLPLDLSPIAFLWRLKLIWWPALHSPLFWSLYLLHSQRNSPESSALSLTQRIPSPWRSHPSLWIPSDRKSPFHAIVLFGQWGLEPSLPPWVLLPHSQNVFRSASKWSLICHRIY